MRTLVVEDDVEFGPLLVELLRELGHDAIGPIASLDDSLRVAEVAPLDCAILDRKLLADVDSEPVARVLAGRGIPFVISSGYDMPDIPSACAPVAFLSKPYRLSELLAAMSTIATASKP